MPILKFTLSLLVSALVPVFSAVAQLPMPDRVFAGTSRIYWVDSVANPGSVYIWAVDNRVIQSGTACAFVRTWDFEGVFGLSLLRISADGCTGLLQYGEVVVNSPAVSPEFELRIYPNPLTGPELKFRITLPVGSEVTLDLFSAGGQLVSRLFEGYLDGGESRTVIYRHNFAQGIYLYQIRADHLISNGRVIIIREY